MDTAFFSSGSKLEEVTMLNAPVTSVPRTATFKIDYENDNLINKPDVHINESHRFHISEQHQY
jgi:hypothetical protein